MAHIVILGAGLGGAIMAYEMKEKMRPEDTITVITKDPIYHFVPSNPWVAVNWRGGRSIIRSTRSAANLSQPEGVDAAHETDADDTDTQHVETPLHCRPRTDRAA